MTPKFITQYRPLTARPFLRNRTYEEHIPCKPLRPYVRCFWSSEGIEGDRDEQLIRVIPDTCMDIIIDMNYTKQTVKSMLYGIQDDTVMVGQGKEKETVLRFAVRFPFWAVRRFLKLDMNGLCNQALDLELLMPGCNTEFEKLLYCRSLEELIACMETYLLGNFQPEGYNPNLYNSIEYLLRSKGRARVSDICGYSAVSQRQMERMFKQEVGISIKRTASLVRYQNVWREVILKEHFNVQEAVERYGYADQSHLLNEFKRFHGLWPSQAKLEALESR